VVVGVGVGLATVWFTDLPLMHPVWLLALTVLSTGILAALGIIAGMWADKFDQLAAFQNFLIMPLTFLSGVFYSIHSLPPFWQALSHWNPVFYMIDGFRWGFFGHSDVAPGLSLLVVGASFVAISGFTLLLLRHGYKLRPAGRRRQLCGNIRVYPAAAQARLQTEVLKWLVHRISNDGLQRRCPVKSSR